MNKIHIVVAGPAKVGKTALVQHLAECLGLSGIKAYPLSDHDKASQWRRVNAIREAAASNELDIEICERRLEQNEHGKYLLYPPSGSEVQEAAELREKLKAAEEKLKEAEAYRVVLQERLNRALATILRAREELRK